MVPDLPIYTFTPDLVGLLTFVVNMLLPLFVALVTNRVTSAATKAVLLLALSAASMVAISALRAVVDDVPWQFVPVLMNVGIAFMFGVLMHFGLWKPLGTSQTVQADFGRKDPPDHL